MLRSTRFVVLSLFFFSLSSTAAIPSARTSIPKVQKLASCSTVCGGYVSCPKKALESPVIKISSAKDLKKVRSGGHYSLERDLRLPDAFETLGQPGKGIKEIVFRGNGYRLENLSMSLFESLQESVVTNLKLTDIHISAQMRGGALAKRIGERTCIDRVHVSDGWIYGTTSTGGLVGVVSGPYSAIARSHASIQVRQRAGILTSFGGLVGLVDLNQKGPTIFMDTSTKTEIHTYDANEVGGLIGKIRIRHPKASMEIENSHALGLVQGRQRVGGLIGSIEGVPGQTGFLHISQSYANTQILGRSWEDLTFPKYSVMSKHVGGFVGYMETGHIVDSYAKGSALGRHSVGGFVGGTPKACHAESPCKITNTYSVTQVTKEDLKIHEEHPKLKSNHVGGFGGDSNNLEVSQSFWDRDKSGVAGSSAGTSKNSAELRSQKTFKDWDFKETWMISPYEEYPKLNPKKRAKRLKATKKN